MEGLKYYLVSVAVKTETDNGKIKKLSEDYLTEASSVTEAEANIVQDWKSVGDVREFNVKSVRETKILKVV